MIVPHPKFLRIWLRLTCDSSCDWNFHPQFLVEELFDFRRGVLGSCLPWFLLADPFSSRFPFSVWCVPHDEPIPVWGDTNDLENLRWLRFRRLNFHSDSQALYNHHSHLLHEIIDVRSTAVVQLGAETSRPRTMAGWSNTVVLPWENFRKIVNDIVRICQPHRVAVVFCQILSH